MGLVRRHDPDRVTGADDAAGDDHAHHAGTSYDGAIGRATGHPLQQALVVRLDLHARVPEAFHADHGVGAEVEQGAGRQAEEVDAAGGHVLAEVTGGDPVPVSGDVVEQLSLEQVHLSEVRLVGIASHARPVLHQRTGMGIALDAEPLEQRDRRHLLLAEPVPRVAVHGDDGLLHGHARNVPSTFVETLDRPTWQARAAAHAARVDVWVQPHLARRSAGEKHPVHDFLFDYYSHRPAALRRWHPGFGVVLEDAEEYEGVKGYGRVVRGREHHSVAENVAYDLGLSVTVDHLRSQLPLLGSTRRLLVATAGRTPTLGCFGLHEWAMVHRADANRHDWPLRLGTTGTDTVVETHRISCSHFDAFRFFTDSARPLNTLNPGRDDRPEFEQPGCLHAGMDLYKHAFRLTPLVPSELVADCFALARDIRVLDMRASPYDFAGLGLEPLRIETLEGKQDYVTAQRGFAERGAPLRARLVAECDRLLAAAPPEG